ncbi:TRAP transporter small permease [Halocynthiibacter namhaensis]|uniref:TRAP transporter small permease n=1 Tax=Halocynthiibacter namhaensis TaxID=1290553 RepID=UPI0005799B73|nr:TRAP transporter small permease [Halocynthiibacter namhaensis]
MHPKPGQSRIDRLEESVIALILGLMVVLAFVNVIVRKSGGNILWAKEMSVFLFAWLVLMGASYAVKKGAHLGVDVVVNATHGKNRKTLGTIAVFVCIVYSFLLLKGSWDYWANFANLPQTTGRWFPLGFEEMKPTSFRSWYIVNDVPNPWFLGWLEGAMNYGDPYDKLPRFIPYAVLPLSMALMLFRFVQAAVDMVKERIDRVVASHEVEDEIEEVRERLGAAMDGIEKGVS